MSRHLTSLGTSMMNVRLIQLTLIDIMQRSKKAQIAAAYFDRFHVTHKSGQNIFTRSRRNFFPKQFRI